MRRRRHQKASASSSLMPCSRAIRAVNGAWRWRAVMPVSQPSVSSVRQAPNPGGQAARGPSIVTSTLLAGEPDNATMPAAGQAFGRQQQNVQQQTARPGSEFHVRFHAEQVQPQSAAGEQAVARTSGVGPYPRVRCPDPRPRAAVSGAASIRPPYPRQPSASRFPPAPHGRFPARLPANPATRSGHGRAVSTAIQPNAVTRSCRHTAHSLTEATPVLPLPAQGLPGCGTARGRSLPGSRRVISAEGCGRARRGASGSPSMRPLRGS